MTKTDWTAEEVHAMAEKLSADVPRFNTEDERLCAVAMLTAFAEHIAADESAAPAAWMRRNVTYKAHDGSNLTGRFEGERIVSELKVYADDEPLFTHPPAQPAQVDVPDWRIAMFDRWREAAQEKGYAGIAEAINAVPDARQPAQEQPGWKNLYILACDSVEEWKVRALKAEEVSDRLMGEINDMNGPSFMGEPVLPKPHKWVHSSKLGGELCEICGVMKGMRRSARACTPRPEFDGTSDPFKPEFDGTTPPKEK